MNTEQLTEANVLAKLISEIAAHIEKVNIDKNVNFDVYISGERGYPEYLPDDLRQKYLTALNERLFVLKAQFKAL